MGTETDKLMVRLAERDKWKKAEPWVLDCPHCSEGLDPVMLQKAGYKLVKSGRKETLINHHIECPSCQKTIQIDMVREESVTYHASFAGKGAKLTLVK
jgi:hypothetical protein